MTTIAHGTATAMAVTGAATWRPIGVGGFGTVYAARTRDGVEVAVKVAHRADDPRFTRERDALERLPRGTAPSLLGHAVTADGRPVLVVELLHGETFAAWLARSPRPSLATSLARFEAACAVVGAAHAAGLVHRDLKPANLFVCRDGSVRVLDFGLARASGGEALDLTAPAQRIGTPAYMAPEQCEGDRGIDMRADIYALGAILFEILTGRTPFVGDAASIIAAHVARRVWPPSLIDASPEIARLDDVVLRCLAKRPEDRYATATALVDAVRGAKATTASVPDPITRQRVALLCVASATSRAELAAAVAPCGGAVARVHGEHHVISFAGAASPRRGVADALRAVARLGERARAARIHVAEVSARASATGPTVLGSAIERPYAWPPATIAYDGAALTDDAARWIERAAVLPTFGEVALRGRDELLARIETEARTRLRDRRPGIAWLEGAVGTGKSRLLRALATRGIAPVLVLAGRDPLAQQDAARTTLRAIFAGDASPGAPHPDPVADTALAHALGTMSRADPALRELLEVPGALRTALATAVAARLRARAPLLVLIDDAHWLDPAILDGLRAAAATPALALWIIATGERKLDDTERHEVSPLADADARALLEDLLRPAEFVPEAVLAPLLAAGRGVPLYLTETVAALRTSGALRRASTGAWYVASDGFENVGGSPLFEQLAERLLAVLPPELAAFARMCALLGDGVEIPAIDAIQRGLERDGDRGGAARARALAPAVGLERLARAGVVSDPAAITFRHPLLREAIERLAPAAERLAIHRAARRYYGEGNERARLARHAAASGEHDHAAAIYLGLGDDARRSHQYVLADRCYTAALEHGETVRAAALAGRGRVRYRIQRMDEALADLDGAIALASDEARAALELDAATVLDWTSRYSEAHDRAERAFAILARLGSHRLEARCHLARGRDAYRGERWHDAIGSLEAGIASSTCDHETRIIAQLLAGQCLVATGRLDDAAATFDTAIAACERRGDDLHLAVAYTNRIWLWSARGELDAAIRDLARAATLARTLGQARLERAAEHNLAEILLWRGELAEARTRARRAYDLHARHVEQPVPEDGLLVARIAIATGDHATARDVLAEVSARCPRGRWSATSAIFADMIALVLADAPPAAWEALRERARGVLFPEELGELARAGRR